MNGKFKIKSVLGFFLFSVFAIIFLVECKKKEEKTVKTYAPNPQPDSIYYYDVNPDIELNSVRTMSTYYSWSGFCTVCIPSDSTAKDTLRSYLPLSATVRSNWGLHGSSCPPIEYSMLLSALRTTDSIASLNFNAELFMPGDTIARRKKYSKMASLKCVSINCYMGNGLINFTGEKYIALKRSDSTGTRYGWMLVECFSDNGLRIKEYAINKAAGNPIKAGQKN